MSGLSVAAIGFGAMLVLIALRMPVGLSMLVVGSIGYIHLSSWAAFFAYMKTNPYYQFANYTLSVIPLSGCSTSGFRAPFAAVAASGWPTAATLQLAPAAIVTVSSDSAGIESRCFCSCSCC